MHEQEKIDLIVTGERNETYSDLKNRQDFKILTFLPVLSSFLLLGTITASLIITSLLKGPAKLSELAFSKGSIWSIGVMASTFPNYLSVWIFHYCAWGKLKEFGYKSCFYFSCLSGLLVQSLLFVSVLVPLESPWLEKKLLRIQEDIIIILILLASMAFTTLSLFLSLKMTKNSSKENDFWIYVKISAFSFMIVIGFVQILLYFYTQIFEHHLFTLLYEITRYIYFYLYALYFSTLYFDIKDLRYAFSFTADQIAFPFTPSDLKI